MEALKERVREFLSTDDGPGYGCGDGSSSGSGTGYGHGSGNVSEYGFGGGSEYGSGYGNCDGSGYGNGDWCGEGFGTGYGYGTSDGIAVIVGETVHDVDGVHTIITTVHAGFAKGYILNSDLTLTPCYIAKGGGRFAHGATLNEAVAALQGKLFEDMPEEKRIAAFIEAHPDKNAKIPARDLWDWHNRLTGSCEMGRNQFAADRGIDIDKDEFTPLEFCEMCKGSYGGDVIRRLEEAYAI